MPSGRVLGLACLASGVFLETDLRLSKIEATEGRDVLGAVPNVSFLTGSFFLDNTLAIFRIRNARPEQNAVVTTVSITAPLMDSLESNTRMIVSMSSFHDVN